MAAAAEGRTEAEGGSGSRVWWRMAQAVSVVSAVAVLLLLVTRPAVALWVTWDVLIPAVPLFLLLAPGVWRNVCPIAVVHQLPASLGARPKRRLSRRVQAWAPGVAMGLLFLIVPTRLVLFNEHGPALALFVVTVLVLALLGGLMYTGKSGWCATFCPVLPVERLYGQQPPVGTMHAHCGDCTGCLSTCYDLKPNASLTRLTGGRGDAAEAAGAALAGTPMGVFGAAFPGFVLGYFTAPASPTLLQAYAWILAVALGGALVMVAIQVVSRLSTPAMMRASAALALGVYYWFSVPSVAAAAHEMLAIPAAGAPGIAAARAFFLVVAAGWLARSLVMSRARAGAPA